MRRAAVATAVVASVSAISAVYAMRVSPMVVEMTTTGTDATARVEVQNMNSGNLAFETRITQVEFDAAGHTTETPADGDFIVFPPQGVLPQGGRQVVRLQWAGPTDMPTSRAYYLSVNQLPVAVDQAGGAQCWLAGRLQHARRKAQEHHVAGVEQGPRGGGHQRQQPLSAG